MILEFNSENEFPGIPLLTEIYVDGS